MSTTPITGIVSELEKPVKVKITLVCEFEAKSLDDITSVKEVIDEAVDVLASEGEMIEAECKEEIKNT